jgi:hypothetical protein
MTPGTSNSTVGVSSRGTGAETVCGVTVKQLTRTLVRRERPVPHAFHPKERPGLEIGPAGWRADAHRSGRWRMSRSTAGQEAVTGHPGGGWGRPPERAEQAPHGLWLGHRPQDPARPGTAGTDEDLDREHAAEERGPGQPTRRPRGLGASRLGVARGRRHDRRAPAGMRGHTPWYARSGRRGRDTARTASTATPRNDILPS